MSTPLPKPPVRVAPLMPLAIAVVAGIILDRYASPFGTMIWLSIAVTAGALGLVTVRSTWIGSLAILLSWAALAGAWHHYRWTDFDNDDLARGMTEAPEPAWLRGVLRDVMGFRPAVSAHDPGTTRAVLEISAISTANGWLAASGRAMLTVLGDRSDLMPGDAVEAAGTLALVGPALNPGEFDYRAYLQAQGIRLRLGVDDPSAVWPDFNAPQRHHPLRWLIPHWLGKARAWSQNQLARQVDPAALPLAAALLLGRREGVDPEVNDAFARTGTTHLLAISGLHMQVLALALGVTLRMLGASRRSAFSLVALATIAYTLLVGLMPSVVRSAAMTLTYCLAGRFDRRGRPANTLALAALATLALNPSHLFDIGCQLSFLAVAVIVWAVEPVLSALRSLRRVDPLQAVERRFEPRWRKWPRKPVQWLTEGVALSTLVWLAAVPLVALRFHIVSPVGILLNLPLIPITSAALLAAGTALSLAAVWTPLGRPPGWLSARLLDLTEIIVRWGAAQPWGHRFVPEPSWLWVLGFYLLLALAAAAFLCHWTRRQVAATLFASWSALGLALAVVPWFVKPSDLPPQAEVLAVGHGLAVLIETGGGRAVLYDCGRMRDPSVGRRVVAPALWARGIHTLDAVILSHADADHYNGLPELLQRTPIQKVLVPEGFSSDANPGAAELLDLVESRGIPVRIVAQGETWNAGATQFTILHPPTGWNLSAPDNARSLVLDVAWQGRHALFTGDLEGEGQNLLLSKPPDGPIDVFLSPHHGGRTANPPSLYDWANPVQVVVSQRPPPAGSRDALALLIPRPLRTWQLGAIRLAWTKTAIIAHGFLDSEREVSSATHAFEFFLGEPVLSALVSLAGFFFGLLAVAILTVVDWGAWIIVLPSRRPGTLHDQVTFSIDPECAERRLGEPIEVIAADGARLAGIWHPADPTSSSGRVVLLVHGFAEDPSSLGARMEALNRHGWDVAALDVRAHGRSEGDRGSFGGREAQDLSTWIDSLSNGKTEPSSACFAVWGRSMGAAIALRAAANDPRIAALVLEAPYLDLEETLVRVLKRKRVPLAKLMGRLLLRRARKLAGVSLTHPRPIDLAATVPDPVMIIHGADDPLIPAAEAQRLANAFPRPSTYLEVPGAGHNSVVDIGGPALLDAVAGFLDQAVAGSPPKSPVKPSEPCK